MAYPNPRKPGECQCGAPAEGGWFGVAALPADANDSPDNYPNGVDDCCRRHLRNWIDQDDGPDDRWQDGPECSVRGCGVPSKGYLTRADGEQENLCFDHIAERLS